MRIRHATEADYPPIIGVLDDWWGGRHMADMLPRLFFVHFQDTSFVLERDGLLVAFLIGFVSQTHPDQAYIHFVGVHPDYRGQGCGEQLYRAFFEAVQQRGCQSVSCVTSPVNRGSIAFHRRLGFQVKPGDALIDGIPIHTNYDGAGQDRVVFVKNISE